MYLHFHQRIWKQGHGKEITATWSREFQIQLINKGEGEEEEEKQEEEEERRKKTEYKFQCSQDRARITGPLQNVV